MEALQAGWYLPKCVTVRDLGERAVLCWEQLLLLAETAGTGYIEPGQDYSASSSNRHAGALQSYTTWNNLELGLVSLWNSYTWHSVMFHNYLENFLEQNINSAKAAYFSVL